MSHNHAFDVLDQQCHSCWKASVSDVQVSSSFLRFTIVSDGKHFDVLYGNCSDYRWIFLPWLEIGCMQAHPSDLFWNVERLSAFLNRKDALTIVFAVRFALSLGDRHD